MKKQLEKRIIILLKNNKRRFYVQFGEILQTFKKSYKKITEKETERNFMKISVLFQCLGVFF